MDRQAFEILALAARYWFLALIAFILLGALGGVWADLRERRRIASGAYGEYVGYVDFLACDVDPDLTGQRFGVRSDAFIGRSRSCDIRIPTRRLAKIECMLYCHKNDVYLSLVKNKNEVYLDGREVTDDVIVRDGAIISVYGAMLKFTRIGDEEE